MTAPVFADCSDEEAAALLGVSVEELPGYLAHVHERSRELAALIAEWERDPFRAGALRRARADLRKGKQ